MLYKFAKAVFSFVFKLFFKIEVFGADKVPTDRAVLLCSNHISLLDFAFIGVHTASDLSYLGKAEIVRVKIFEKLLKSLGFIPIRRGMSDIGAIKKLITTIENGKSVLIFPQGTRKRKLSVRETSFKNGAALVQKKTGCAVIPISVTTKTMTVRLFSKITVRFGNLFEPSEFQNADNDAITDKIFNETVRLSEEK